MYNEDYFDDFNYEEEVEQQTEGVIEDWKADAYLQRVKENNAHLDKLRNIADERKKHIDYQYTLQEEKVKKENHFLLTTLRNYTLNQESSKESKTQIKNKSLSGEIIVKKPTVKMTKPSNDVLDTIESLYPEHVQEVTSKKLDWAGLKKKLTIQGESVFDESTGEKLDGLINTEVTPEETIVK